MTRDEMRALAEKFWGFRGQDRDGKRYHFPVPPKDEDKVDCLLALLTEVAADARKEALETLSKLHTCVVCGCALEMVPEEPPHCHDCYPGPDEHCAWEDTAESIRALAAKETT
jgi:hypothetical protein